MWINSPLNQFNIIEIWTISWATMKISITNINIYTIIPVIIIVLISKITLKKERVIMNGITITQEVMYNSILEMVKEQIGKKEEKYMPGIYSIFNYILWINILGMIPYSFTATTHLALTLSLSIAIIIGVTIIGIKIHKIGYLSYFVPSGTPLVLVPILITIEIISYIAKSISLGVRLSANLLSGHMLLKIISNFVWEFITKNVVTAVIGILPIMLLISLIGLEICVAVLQAFVFTILTSSYIKDSIYLH